MVIELGAGVGYVGIHLALALDAWFVARPAQASEPPPTIVMTDLGNVCPLLERNLHCAFPHGAKQVDARVMPLSWGCDQEAHTVLRACPAPPTHILCSDLIYFPTLLPLLLRSLILLTDDPEHSPTVIIAYRVRSLAKEQPFWQAFGAWFDLSPVQARRSTLPTRDAASKDRPWHRFGSWASDIFPQATDEPPEDDYFVFVASRRADSYLHTPPPDDTKLMGGWRISKAQGAESAPSAGDTFELLLLGDLADV